MVAQKREVLCLRAKVRSVGQLSWDTNIQRHMCVHADTYTYTVYSQMKQKWLWIAGCCEMSCSLCRCCYYIAMTAINTHTQTETKCHNSTLPCVSSLTAISSFYPLELSHISLTKKTTKTSLLTVNDKKEENKVPSSYLDNFANTPSKMVTNQ